jgi:hypothetical protein
MTMCGFSPHLHNYQLTHFQVNNFDAHTGHGRTATLLVPPVDVNLQILFFGHISSDSPNVELISDRT